MLCLPLTAIAQQTGFDKLVEKYSTMQHCTTIELQKDMLQSMGAKSDIDSLLAVSVESEELLDNFREDILKATQGYSTLMTVNNGGNQVRLYGKRTNGVLTEVIVLTTTDSEGVVVRITGKNISLSEATSLIDL